MKPHQAFTMALPTSIQCMTAYVFNLASEYNACHSTATLNEIQNYYITQSTANPHMLLL